MKVEKHSAAYSNIICTVFRSLIVEKKIIIKLESAKAEHKAGEVVAKGRREGDIRAIYTRKNKTRLT